ncbi:SAF domain-containing protein [Cohnella mopanensis]|uniref:SAF domain-containing protein n=1 Tax=Cohnella mopanensis TaxID=2911966 RepID=UPI001EF8DFE7|nr:SAF domain-containing protein [Cohnella mopanensis]
MNIEWNWKTIVVLISIIVLFILTNVGQYFILWGPKQEAMTKKFEEEKAVLQATIDEYGPMVGIWTVKEGASELFPGKTIEETDLELREIPQSLLTRSFILDPEAIIGKYYRIGLNSGTPLSMDFVMDDPIDDTTRDYDVVANVLPIGIKVGDYIDYRIVYPRGEDFIVLTHKRIEAIHDKTMKLRMTENEIHFYQAALVDYFLQKSDGATLYMARYVEPGIQKPAIEYYAIPKNIQSIMMLDPNVAEQVNGEINDTRRKIIDAAILSVTAEIGSVISSGRSEIQGKIDSGATQLENDAKALMDLQAQNALNSQPDQGTTTQPSSGTPKSSNSSSFTVEEGVVE